MKRTSLFVVTGVACAILFFVGLNTILGAHDKATAAAKAISNKTTSTSYTRAYEATLFNTKQVGTIMAWVGGAGIITCIGGGIILLLKKEAPLPF